MKERYRNNLTVRQLFNILILGLALMPLAGCRSGRVITTEAAQEKGLSNKKLIFLLEQGTKSFNTLKFRKADVEITMNNARNNVKSNIAIFRDSMIAVSIMPVLGYEAIRILCLKDSVIVINRKEKSYYASSYEYFRRKFKIPVGFSELQAILSNELFYYKPDYEDRTYKKQFVKNEKTDQFLIDSYKNENRSTSQGFGIDREKILIENVNIVDYDKRMRINLDYDDFSKENGWLFPMKISVDISESSNNINMVIKFDEIVFDEALNIEFIAPQNYTREDL